MITSKEIHQSKRGEIMKMCHVCQGNLVLLELSQGEKPSYYMCKNPIYKMHRIAIAW